MAKNKENLKDIQEETAKLVKLAKENVQVLSTYRIEKRGDDAVVLERVIVSDAYAGQKNVKEFETPNGKITYYVEKPVKKYSDNVARA